jgi:hypothetical protein
MHTHDVVALTTLTSIFRVAVERAYEQDDAFHQDLKQKTPATLLQDLIDLEARLDAADAKADYSRDHYVGILAFNEKFMQAYTAIAGDEAIKSHIPQGQGSRAMAEDLRRFGCPTLARLFTPARAAAKP